MTWDYRTVFARRPAHLPSTSPGESEARLRDHDGVVCGAKAREHVSENDSYGLHHLCDGVRQTLPVIGFFGELLPTKRSQPVVLGAPVVGRLAPFGINPAVELQAVERWIQRALFDAEDFVGCLFDDLGDSIAVLRASGQRFQNEHVERALDKFSV